MCVMSHPTEVHSSDPAAALLSKVSQRIYQVALEYCSMGLLKKDKLASSSKVYVMTWHNKQDKNALLPHQEIRFAFHAVQ